MSSKELRARGIKTVEGTNRPNPFPGKGKPPRVGNQFPRQVGLTPNVVRGDALTPILPKGMVANPAMVDESVNGEAMSFDGI